MTPVPKPARRIVDPEPGRKLRLRRLACAGGCGQVGTNAAHLIPRGQGGDDVPENLLPLCGNGNASGCHGADHGTPSLGHDPVLVRARIAAYVAARPHMIRYVLEKMGDEAGRDYLWRRCGLLLTGQP